MKTNRTMVVIALLLSVFMAAMEFTVVSTAMPTVIGDLGGIRLYSWVFTAYMLASTVTVPIYGKIADLRGRKPVMLFGLVLFLLGSMASGQAHSMPQLIAFRTLQGLGAGAMQPISLTIIGDIFSVEERARMQGLFGSVWGFAGLVGPLLGGIIVKVLSWRWVFYINVPFGIASGLLLMTALHEGIEKHPHTLDWGGVALFTIACVALLMGAHGGMLAAIGLPIAALGFALFFRAERRSPEPILPLELFSRRVMAVSSAAGVLVGAVMMASVTYIPLYVQGVRGLSPTQAGATLTPIVIGWPVASAIGGRLSLRLGYRHLVIWGLALVAGASVLLAWSLAHTTGLAIPRIAMGIMGAGMGFSTIAILLAVQTSVEWSQRGVATSSTMFFRIMGGAIAIGILGAILASHLEGVPSASPDQANQLLGPTHGHGLPPQVFRALASALDQSLITIFWVIAAIAVLAFLVSLSFPSLRSPRTGEAPAASGAEG
ncbi:MAG: MDR family MFS transporter [Candidatus Eisenbacteria bacterium]